MHVIAAKAVAFGEALDPAFKLYARDTVVNARALAAVLAEGGLAIVSGGTDSHLVLVDLRPLGLTGKAAEAALGRVGLTCNKNGIPFDPEKPAITSGIRLGSSASTSRGFGEREFREIGALILQTLKRLVAGTSDETGGDDRIAQRVRELCQSHPIYPNARQ